MFARAIAQALATEGPLSPIAITARLSLAGARQENGAQKQAREPLDAALAALRASGGVGDIRAAREEANFIVHAFQLTQVEAPEALTVLQRCRATLDRHGALVPERIRAQLALNTALLMVDWGDLRAAAPVLEEAALVYERLDEVGARFMLTALRGMTALYLGPPEQAEAALRQRLELQRRGGREATPLAAYDHAFLTVALLAQGRFTDAERLLKQAPDFEATRRANEAAGNAMSEATAVVRRMQARVMLERGEAAQAARMLPPAALDTDWKFPTDDYALRGNILCATGEHLAGLEVLERTLARHVRSDHPAHPDLGRLAAQVGLCAMAAGRTDRAAALAGQAAEVFQHSGTVQAYFSEPLRELQRRLGRRKGA
jgi:tetratricopeptide (TPR) repeat protein